MISGTASDEPPLWNLHRLFMHYLSPQVHTILAGKKGRPPVGSVAMQTLMKSASINLLVVDDELSIRRVLRASLGANGYAMREASNGKAALETLHQAPPDLVLLDINMPGMSGIEVCRRIRQMAPETGIVMISVRGQEQDTVQALEAGADDYLTKPFRFGELNARLRAVYRRLHPQGPARTLVLRAGDLELDLEKRILRKSGGEVHLSQKEFDILAYLMRRPNTTVPHARLLQAVWGPEYGGETEYLRTYIRILRRKTETDPSKPEYIFTEPWFGYRFHDPAHLDMGVEPIPHFAS